MEIVKNYKYLGINITTRRLTTLYTDYFAQIQRKANKRLQCIKHYGFHNDGLRPGTALKLYILLIRPILEYGAQVLIYDHYYLKSKFVKTASLDRQADFVKQLEKFQTKALKYLLGCPKSTSPKIVRLFSGIEPISCRFDLLKLRYFWKISHGDENNIAFKVYKKRRSNFFSAKKGFVHEVFNLCCKYDAIDFWHGKMPQNIDPYLFIKNKVKNYYLKQDLEIGRRKLCGFADVYLQNKFLYQEDYQLIEPFKRFNFFSSTRARSIMTKVLLYPREFKVDCDLCDGIFTYIFNHYVYDCANLKTLRQHLRNMLNFYNFPKDCLLKNSKFLATCLQKKVWTKCLTEFLEEANY